MRDDFYSRVARRAWVSVPRTSGAFGGVWLLTLCLVACAERGITYPADAHRFVAPAQYRPWWQVTESCTGRMGRLEDIAWYVVPATSFNALTVEGTRDVQGLYDPTNRRIVIAEGSVADGQLVRHEMAHALSGVTGHPPSVFGGNCAGVLACEDLCASEAVAPIAADTVVLAGTLALTVAVEPASLRGKETGGWLTVIVSLENRSARAVAVQGAGSNGPTSSWLGVSIAEHGRDMFRGTHLSGDSTAVIAAHGALRYAFDVLLFPGGGVTREGVASVRGALGGDSSAAVLVPYSP
jgi:hypothetical protein